MASPPAIQQIEAGDAENKIPQKDIIDATDEFAASKQFLKMVHYDEKPASSVPGGRLYTYVLTLQGEWRFTETGPEFAIQFLSKHSMHSDVAEEVAFAGEFFVRRRRGKGGMKLSDDVDTAGETASEEKETEEEKERGEFEEPGVGVGESEHGDGHASDGSSHIATESKHHGDMIRMSNKPAHTVGRSRDPRNFVLIIDNASGTYRPHKKTLPELQRYLERNLPGMKIKAMACDDERLKKLKDEQKPKKEVVKARRIAQRSDSSDNSSDDDDIEP